MLQHRNSTAQPISKVDLFRSQSQISYQKNYQKDRDDGNRLNQDFRHVKDSIYTEYIRFPEFFWRYIDNPVYARLKNLYQLGTLYHVFPGATHTRFAHSLGVGHLANKQMVHLLYKMYEEMEVPLPTLGGGCSQSQILAVD